MFISKDPWGLNPSKWNSCDRQIAYRPCGLLSSGEWNDYLVFSGSVRCTRVHEVRGVMMG